MITDNDCNKVFFSERLNEKYPNEFEVIESILKGYDYEANLLAGTNDIWARDYMPIQVDKERFIQFRYEPSYLKNDPHLLSVPKDVIAKNNIQAKFSSINLDGGNVVKYSDKVILTDRIFSENPKYEQTRLVNELELLFKAQVIIIPSINGDLTGHADGHLRFINNDTLLVNSLGSELKYWRDGFIRAIKNSGLKFIEMPWFEYKNSKYRHNAIGVYVNYLELQDLIIFPVFDVSNNKDEEALNIIKKLFPNKSVEPININAIGLEGGLLNCISWTINNNQSVKQTF